MKLDLDLLERIRADVHPLLGQGHIPTYIAPLAQVPAHKFGMAVCTIDGETFAVGDAHEPFSIQSISKVLTLTQALNLRHDEIWHRLGREPSGNPFNSLVQLERERGKPRNPFINAGAIVIADIILEYSDTEPLAALLDFTRDLSGNPRIEYDPIVARAESESGHTNRALANFIKSFGNLHNDVEAVLDFYFHQCSLALSCVDLAKTFSFLANGGVSPITGAQIVTPRRAKRINAVMLTCGLYDNVGDFAFRVGLPGKSGVGGGIAAVVPGRLAAVVWSPGLNEYGSSLAGVKALELLTTYMGNSIF
jgi:glutaminase